MATTTTLLSLPFLLLLLAATSLPRSNADAAFIAKTCNNTDKFDFCMSTLKSDPRSINATNLDDLTRIALDIALADANGLAAYIDQLADQNPGTLLEEYLHQCAQIFGNAIEDLKEAQEAIGSKEYNGAADSVNLAYDAPDNCEGEFSDVTSPITDRNQKVKDHVDLCGNLIDLLQS